MRATRLSDEEVVAALEELPGWAREGDKLHREFRFEDFRAAFGFMTACALTAEAMSHHPEWRNVYDRVEVWLTTHDAGGITGSDFDLAKDMSRRALSA